MAVLASLLEQGEPGRPALVVPGGPSLTYRQLKEAVNSAAGHLAGLGVRPGDRVALVLPNGAESVVLFLAASLVGTAAPLNPAYTVDEFRFYLEDTSARALIVPRGSGDEARTAAGSNVLIIEADVDKDATVQFSASGTAGPERAGDPPESDD